MRTPYPVPIPQPTARTRRAVPGPQLGRRVSLLAVQEAIQLPTPRGFVGARRLEIVRIEQTAALSEDLIVPRAPRREPTPQPGSQAEPPESADLECWLEGKRVRLRVVAEMMADEAGNFYEVSGQQLRPLGELVSDEHGRVFEVQPASEPHPAAAQDSQSESSGGQAQAARAAATDNNLRTCA